MSKCRKIEGTIFEVLEQVYSVKTIPYLVMFVVITTMPTVAVFQTKNRLLKKRILSRFK